MFYYEIGVYVSPFYKIGYPFEKVIVWDSKH